MTVQTENTDVVTGTETSATAVNKGLTEIKDFVELARIANRHMTFNLATRLLANDEAAQHNYDGERRAALVKTSSALQENFYLGKHNISSGRQDEAFKYLVSDAFYKNTGSLKATPSDDLKHLAAIAATENILEEKHAIPLLECLANAHMTYNLAAQLLTSRENDTENYEADYKDALTKTANTMKEKFYGELPDISEENYDAALKNMISASFIKNTKSLDSLPDITLRHAMATSSIEIISEGMLKFSDLSLDSQHLAREAAARPMIRDKKIPSFVNPESMYENLADDYFPEELRTYFPRQELKIPEEDFNDPNWEYYGFDLAASAPS